MPRLRQRSTSAAWSPRVAYGQPVNKLIRGAFGNVPSNPEAAVLVPKSVVPQSFMDAVTKTVDGDAEGAAPCQKGYRDDDSGVVDLDDELTADDEVDETALAMQALRACRRVHRHRWRSQLGVVRRRFGVTPAAR
ncbi:MAG TPA: hypothetical protein VEX40_09310 [Mycobacterium sp.]|nr:hypothetical protein [Mycobacterium sp.]